MTHRCLMKNPERENRLVARERFEPTTKGLWACQLPAAGARLYHHKDKWRGRDLNPRPRAYGLASCLRQVQGSTTIKINGEGGI